MNDDTIMDRAIGAFVGLAVGDALGTPLEFKQRDDYEPVADFIGGGPFHLRPGEWTDDTSMALCLADSLLVDPDLYARDLMDRFVRWWQKGENSVTGRCFDIGGATRAALARYRESGNPVAGSTDPNSAGNGSIMRLAPAMVRWHGDAARAVAEARAQSRVTHGAAAAVEGCALLSEILFDCIATGDKGRALRPRESAEPLLAPVAAGSWQSKTRAEIRSSGYVVDTLEAALWATDASADFAEAVLKAVNLGDDADTVGAVAGQIAGALYGAAAIPQEWTRRLAWADIIREKAERLFAAGARP